MEKVRGETGRASLVRGGERRNGKVRGVLILLTLGWWWRIRRLLLRGGNRMIMTRRAGEWKEEGWGGGWGQWSYNDTGGGRRKGWGGRG